MSVHISCDEVFFYLHDRWTSDEYVPIATESYGLLQTGFAALLVIVGASVWVGGKTVLPNDCLCDEAGPEIIDAGREIGWRGLGRTLHIPILVYNYSRPLVGRAFRLQ